MVATVPYLLDKAQCPDNMFCEIDMEKGPKYPDSKLLPTDTGLCVANAPDCGKLGKLCCIANLGQSGPYPECRPENGKKGYCVSASGKYQDLICTLCPDKVPAGFKYASECRA
jgi:hypothetical protein